MASRDGDRPRVYAMARPKRPLREAVLLAEASVEIGAEGSRKARSNAIAVRVAQLAILDVTLVESDLPAHLRLAEAHLHHPCLAALAVAPDIDTASVVRSEAVKQFEARGCRYPAQAEIPLAQSELVQAVSKRLENRYRRQLK